MNIAKQSKWISRDLLNAKRSSIDDNLYKWLVLPNNLAETIKKTGSQFSLTLLSQSLSLPYSDEENIFKDYLVDVTPSFIRRVFLNANKQVVVFARVVVPKQTYLDYQYEFSKLGTNAIGNSILYADKQIERGVFEYKLIQRVDPVFQELKDLNQIKDRNLCWGRRSIFKLPKGPLLISEFFLNKIPKYP